MVEAQTEIQALTPYPDPRANRLRGMVQHLKHDKSEFCSYCRAKSNKAWDKYCNKKSAPHRFPIDCDEEASVPQGYRHLRLDQYLILRQKQRKLWQRDQANRANQPRFSLDGEFEDHTSPDATEEVKSNSNHAPWHPRQLSGPKRRFDSTLSHRHSQMKHLLSSAKGCLGKQSQSVPKSFVVLSPERERNEGWKKLEATKNVHISQEVHQECRPDAGEGDLLNNVSGLKLDSMAQSHGVDGDGEGDEQDEATEDAEAQRLLGKSSAMTKKKTRNVCSDMRYGLRRLSHHRLSKKESELSWKTPWSCTLDDRRHGRVMEEADISAAWGGIKSVESRLVDVSGRLREQTPQPVDEAMATTTDETEPHHMCTPNQDCPLCHDTTSMWDRYQVHGREMC